MKLLVSDSLRNYNDQITTAFIDNLPPGLSLSPEGVISGTPTVGGVYEFTIAVTDSEGMMMSVRVMAYFEHNEVVV